jgi:hypothetical protein
MKTARTTVATTATDTMLGIPPFISAAGLHSGGQESRGLQFCAIRRCFVVTVETSRLRSKPLNERNRLVPTGWGSIVVGSKPEYILPGSPTCSRVTSRHIAFRLSIAEGSSCEHRFCMTLLESDQSPLRVRNGILVPRRYWDVGLSDRCIRLQLGGNSEPRAGPLDCASLKPRRLPACCVHSSRKCQE